MAARVGNIAEGKDFFARQTELEDLWTYLEGNHVVLSGPRRLGKSSLLKRLVEQAEGQGLLSKLIDVEGIDTVEAFIEALDCAFPDTTVTGFIKNSTAKVGTWFNRVRKVSATLPAAVGGGGGSVELEAQPQTPWHQRALALKQRLSDAPVLILIDEFSVFLEKLIARDTHQAELLLGWLRTWRQDATPSRFVFSGSIGINALLERHSLSTRMNDCYEFKLGPFRLSEACDMLTEVARREDWQLLPDTANYLCARIGWRSPFYLNLLIDGTCKAARDRVLETTAFDRVLQTTDVDDAYDRQLTTRSRFSHWYQRLKRDLMEPDLTFCLTVLSHAAKATKSLSRAQMLARLSKLEPLAPRRAERLASALLYLEEQGYLIFDGQTVHFLSFLLRDYWKRNHAF